MIKRNKRNRSSSANLKYKKGQAPQKKATRKSTNNTISQNYGNRKVLESSKVPLNAFSTENLYQLKKQEELKEKESPVFAAGMTPSQWRSINEYQIIGQSHRKKENYNIAIDHYFNLRSMYKKINTIKFQKKSKPWELATQKIERIEKLPQQDKESTAILKKKKPKRKPVEILETNHAIVKKVKRSKVQKNQNKKKKIKPQKENKEISKTYKNPKIPKDKSVNHKQGIIKLNKKQEKKVIETNTESSVNKSQSDINIDDCAPEIEQEVHQESNENIFNLDSDKNCLEPDLFDNQNDNIEESSDSRIASKHEYEQHQDEIEEKEEEEYEMNEEEILEKIPALEDLTENKINEFRDAIIELIITYEIYTKEEFDNLFDAVCLKNEKYDAEVLEEIFEQLKEYLYEQLRDPEVDSPLHSNR